MLLILNTIYASYNALAPLDKSPNQVAVSIEVVGFMRGKEDKEKGGVGAIDITALVLSELHAS